MSAERIVSDIEFLIDRYKARGSIFKEDNFVFDKKRTHRFCELILEKSLRIKWACEARVDSLDKDSMELMHRAGCRGFFIGVESGNQRLLDFLRKGFALDEVRRAFSYSKNIGIRTFVSFIIAIPTETNKELLETIKFSEEIDSYASFFNIFTGMPYSELYNYVKSNHLYDFIDERGIVFIKNYNFLVDQTLGGLPEAKISSNTATNVKGHLFDKKLLSKKERKVVSRFYFRQAYLLLPNHRECIRKLISYSLSFNFLNLYSYLIFLITFLPSRIIEILIKRVGKRPKVFTIFRRVLKFLSPLKKIY